MYTSLAPLFGWAVLLAIFLAAVFKGGPAEKSGAALVLVASIATMSVHLIAAKITHSYLLLAIDGLTAVAFLLIALRFTSAWIGVAVLLLAAQFSLHAYYLVAERPHDRLYSIVNNLNTLGVLGSILVGTLIAWRKRARLAK